MGRYRCESIGVFYESEQQFLLNVSTHLLACLGWFCPVVSEQ